MIGTVLGFLLGDAWGRRRTRRVEVQAAADGRVVSAVRAVEGRVPGLLDSWHGGEWRVEPGLLTLGRVRVPVDSIDEGSRRPTLRDSLAVDDDARIVRCLTGTAVVEWAVPEHLIEQAFGLLRPGEARR